MSLYFTFDPTKNYIGNREWQYKITKYIAKYFPEINFTSAKHDAHYSLMFAEKHLLSKFFMKLAYDIVFLILGLVRLLHKPKQWLGFLIHPILFVVILAYTPVLLFRNRKRYTDLSLPKKYLKNGNTQN